MMKCIIFTQSLHLPKLNIPVPPLWRGERDVQHQEGGFTTIELLVVMMIMAVLSTALMLNFRVSNTDRNARVQVASVIISDIRRAQNMAISGSRYQNNLVCGFGVHFINQDSYMIYAKAVPVSGSCADVSTRNYYSSAPADFVVETRVIANNKLEIRSSFPDIFFEPPNPRTYINNDASLTALPSVITIQIENQSDCSGQSCTEVRVYTAGRIDTANF